MREDCYEILDLNEIKEQYSFVKNEIDPYEAGIPLFDISDETIRQIYYFRWHTFCKHIRRIPDGYVVTEFFDNVPWAGKYNTINCPAAHHLYEGRWIHERKYIDSYMNFWFTSDAEPRKYSFPVADAVLAVCKLRGDHSMADALYEKLKENYESWEKEKKHPSGLFYQTDNRDGMEYSISGSGLRPTINSYMYGDSLALSEIARRLGKNDEAQCFEFKASDIKERVEGKLWDEDACFYKTLSEAIGYNKADVREEIGYVPWCYNLPDADKSEAWKYLWDEEYFGAPYGPTTAERNHPRFMEKFDHECLWNGPSWPFATSQTIAALGNLLTYYEQNIMKPSDYFRLLKQYAGQHFITEDGKKQPFIDENLDPFTGEWIAKRELEAMSDPPGGAERGRDYNHSSFCDLVLSGLVGIRAGDDNKLLLSPLFDEKDVDYLCADGILYHGHYIAVLWDKKGERYNRGKGFKVYINGEERINVAKPQKLIINIC